jgi:hypothetical protein
VILAILLALSVAFVPPKVTAPILLALAAALLVLGHPPATCAALALIAIGSLLYERQHGSS